MPFGEKLRELRGKKSQSEIADEIGVTKSSWAMYERNERVPRDEVKIRIYDECRYVLMDHPITARVIK